MTLTAQCVIAAEAMVDVGHTVFEQRIEVPLIDPLEILLSDSFDDGVIHVQSPYGCLFPGFCRSIPRNTVDVYVAYIDSVFLVRRVLDPYGWLKNWRRMGRRCSKFGLSIIAVERAPSAVSVAKPCAKAHAVTARWAASSLDFSASSDRP